VPIALPDLSGYAPLASPIFTGNPTAPTPAPGTTGTRLATADFVITALASIPPSAPLDSPSFTGSPMAPTPPPGDSTGRLATTAFTAAAIAALNLAQFAPLASPGLTGTPTAPTPSGGDDNQIATAGWVRSMIELGTTMLSVGPTPPTGVAANTLWWNSSDVSPGGAKLFLLYDDGDSQQWVPASMGATGPQGGPGLKGDPGTPGGPGEPGPASVLQVIDTMSAEWGYFGTQPAMPLNDAPRTTAMGMEVDRVVVVPQSADSVLDISAFYNISTTASDNFGIVVFRDGEPLVSGWQWIGSSQLMQMQAQRRVLSGSTAPTTFTVHIGANGATGYGVNGSSGSRLFGGSLQSGLVIREEIAP
jgi:hypothetical protein